MSEPDCVLCGVQVAAYRGDLPPLGPVPWTSQARAVCSRSYNQVPFLTGVGVFGRAIQLFDEFDNAIPLGLWASQNQDISFAGIGVFDDLSWHQFYVRRGYGCPFYIFHDACWRILLYRIAEKLPDRSPMMIARILFYLLQCIPEGPGYTLLVGHEYGGARGLLEDLTSYDEDTIANTGAFFFVDPTGGTAPPVRLSTFEPSDHSALPARPSRSFRAEDPFYCLPPEILTQVLIALPSDDVCNLRLASGGVARVSSPTDLPQSFWKSRFATNMEMGGAFALQPHHHRGTIRDWRTAYTSIRAPSEGDPLGLALQNKLRIWKCIGHFCDSLEPLLTERTQSWREHVPTQPGLGRKWKGPFVRSHFSRMTSNEVLLLPLSSPVRSPRLVSVSTILFNCRRYLCGVRVRHRSGNNVGATISEVGMSLPATEEHLDLNGGDSLESLCLYTVMDGIVGIQFRVQKKKRLSIPTPRTHFFGHCRGSNAVAAANLKTPPSKAVYRIAFGFDVCKCVSIQLITEPRSLTAPAASCADGSEPPIMWMAGIPRSLTDVSPLRYTNLGATMLEPRCPLRLHVDFGGPNGEKLRLLNRIIGVFDVRYDLLIGLRFAYDDGTDGFYGPCQRLGNETCQRPCHEMSLIVDGKQGERVDAITIVPHRPSNWFQEFVGGLRLSTNFGVECLLGAQKFPMEGGYPNHARKKENFLLKPRGGRVISGLVVELSGFGDDTRRRGGYFQGIGVCGSRGTRIVSYLTLASTSSVINHRVPVTADHVKVFKRQLLYHGCYFTGSSLENVRRIRFSESRNDGMPSLTGLRLEYWNGSTAILEQWVVEVGSMEIDKGDSIVHIRASFSQGCFLEEASSADRNHGKTVGIMIETASGTSQGHSVLKSAADFSVDYHANRFEHMCGLVWAFNDHWDLLHVLWRAPPTAAVPSLIFNHTENYYGGTGDDMGRFLWEEVDTRGNAVLLSQIDFYFRTKLLVGLSFSYAGTVAQRSIGIIEGEKVSLCLRQYEKILAIDMNRPGLMRDPRGVLVVIYTNQRQNIAAHESSMPRATRSQRRTLKRSWFHAVPIGQEITTSRSHQLDSEELRLPPGCSESLGMCVQFDKKPQRPYHICGLGGIFPGS